MLMQFGNAQGWAYAVGSEIEELKKQGWVESSEDERLSIIDKKRKAIELKNAPKVAEFVTMKPQQEAVKGKPGRKPKNFYLGGTHGNNPNKG